MIKAALCLILAACIVCIPSSIYSRTITTTYSEFGAFNSFVIQFKPIADICGTCLLELQFPETIHLPSTPLQFALSNEFGDVLIQSGQSLVPTSNNYYFSFASTINGSVWYTIQIWPAVSPSLVYGLVGIVVVSQVATPNIVYLSNTAFEYYHLQAIVLPPQNIALNPITSANTQPAAAYPYQLSFSSTYVTNDSTTLSLTFNNQNYALISSSTALVQNNNFNFFGSCQIICNTTACLPQISCSIANNQLKLVLPYLTSQLYTLQFYVLNPNFVDTTGLAAQIYDANGLIQGINIINNVFSTSPIAILSAPAFLHWGIPLNVVTNTMNLGLFVDGGWNTLDLGFTLSSVTAIGSQFTVTMYVGASWVLEHSINTNLPQLNATTPQRCTYTNPYIVCTPVDSFASTTLRYYIRFKAYFASSDSINTLGSVTITIPNSPNSLFTPLTQNLPINTVPWADYHDYAGFHNSALHAIQETQVLGSFDSGLVNATSSFMDSLSSSAFVGIDPQISNQQLIFLLKTSLGQVSNGAGSQNYQMKVYFNPNPFQSISNKGIDFTAYNSTLNKYQNEAASCFIDSSANATIQIFQCQAYNDYVYNAQYDNTLSLSTYFGQYDFTCGNGQKVVCATANCAESCRLFKGQSNAQSYSGVFSIRNVTFKEGYQSPYLANNMVLDFIVAFYQAGTLVSASLLNAYTLKSSRLSLLSTQFHNVYLSPTQFNTGSRVPTLLGLNGAMSVGELAGYNFDKLMLFLPNEVSVNSFLEGGGRVGCSKSCSGYEYSVGVSMVRDNWLFKQAVVISSSLNLQSNLNFKLPVLITSAVLGSIELALFANNTLVRVYRLNGSAVGENFNTPASPVVTVNGAVSAWSNPDYWVMTGSDQYKQTLNLNQIAAFSSQNTIDMSGSILTYSDNPSSTFTSTHQSIFSPYSTAIANTLSLCDSPFTYTYNMLYNITVLWCPLSAFQGNQILINYPYYPTNIGSGFPFSQIFSYAIEDGSGNLIAFRTQSGTKTTQGTCTTASTNIYNYAEVTKQSLSISLSLSASLMLSTDTYTSFSLLLTLPTTIPVSFISCQVQQTLLSILFGCTMTNATANQVSLVMTYNGVNPIAVISLQLTVWVQAAGATSVVPTATYYYTVGLVLPQTDASNLPTFYGVGYNPYSSTTQTCTSTLTLSSIAATSQPIIISGLQIRAISLNYLCELSWSVSFANSRKSLLPGQQIVIQLGNVQSTGETMCQLSPQNYSFDVVSLTSSSITLVSNRVIDGFTLVGYELSCSQLLLVSNGAWVSMSWVDGGNTLQQSNSISLSTAYPSTSTISSSVISKNYNTLGYDSQYTLTIMQSTSLEDRVQLWLDFTNAHIHTLSLQCYYLSSTTVQIYCAEDWSGKVHVSLSASTLPNVTITLYGMRQLNPSTVSSLLLVAVNQTNYFISTMSDGLAASVVSSAPIIIQSTTVTYNATALNYCVQIGFVFPVAYSSSLMVVLDDSFLMSYPLLLNCLVNSIAYPCSRSAPNLATISSTAALSPAAINTLSICGLTPNSKVLIDSQLTFKIFTTSAQSVSMGSHDHRVSSLLLNQIPNYPNYQEWSYSLNTSWSTHVIYVGYYASSLQLSTIPPTPYTQKIGQNYSSLNSRSYLNSSLEIEMGESALGWEVAASDYSYMNLADSLQYTTSSSVYAGAPVLAIYVSGAKCQIGVEYSSYQIYPSGITIPILLDFSSCRPVSTHYLNYTINTPYLAIDTTLSNSIVNSTYYQPYVIIRQIPSYSFSGSFTLQTTLTGPFAASFNPIPSATIQVSPSSLLQIPQSQLPNLNQVDSSSVNVSMQCNQPSTMYWALALSPAILGVTAADIQAKLTIAGIGVVSPYRDSYSWAGEIYGFTYSVNANDNKSVYVDHLQGSSNYNFKYYCVNQLGYPSAGQLLNFTTLQSLYGLTKVTLTYSSTLTIYQANQLACQMAEVLLTPYRTITTSTFSNCYNTSNAIYPTPTTPYYDELQSGQYNYFFYINTNTATINQILSTLPTNLPLYQSFILNSSPYNSISTMALTNNYSPAILSSNVSTTTDSISLTADVGVTNSYLVLAYINKTFDINTMSLPTTYMIKQGNFSVDTQFNQVFMLYGHNAITLNISQLAQYQNYSIFYYATVDNPALNSRSTQVYYQNVQTLTYVVYYLHSEYAALCVLIGLLLTLL